LVGTWDWMSTTVRDYCDGYQVYVLDSLTENTTYQIEFLKEGLIRFYKNKELQSEHEIQFKRIDIPEQGIVESNKEVEIIFYLDGDKDNSMNIFGTQKQMRFNYFPYVSNQECNQYYGNFFEKDN
jgi:hypothetical protein